MAQRIVLVRKATGMPDRRAWFPHQARRNRLAADLSLAPEVIGL